MIKQRQQSRCKQRFLQQKPAKCNTISPYLSQLERRKKLRSANKNRRKIPHKTSQKSFRIKQQRSSASLHVKLLNTDERSNINLNKKQQTDQNEQTLFRDKRALIIQSPTIRQASNGLVAKLAKIKAGCTTSSQMKDKKKLNFANNPSNENPDLSINSQFSKTIDHYSHFITNDIVSLLSKQQLTQNRTKTPCSTKNISSHAKAQEQQRQDKERKLQRQKSKQKSNQFFKDLYNKIETNKKNKNNGKGPVVFQRSVHKYALANVSKEKSIQLNMSKHSGQRSSKLQIQQITYQKLGYTDVGSRNKNQAQKGTQIFLDKTENVIKTNKNFRKNKYEVLHYSVTSKDKELQAEMRQQINQVFKSQNNLTFDLEKKQSNASLNKQMDQLAVRQMKRFYRQKRSKQIEKSIQKSTQKYLGQGNYRPLKSKNDIEIYLSTVANPRKNKQSRESTLNSSNKHNSIYISFNKDEPKEIGQINSQQKSKKNLKSLRTNNFFDYDFNFGNQQEREQIQCIENSSQEDSLNLRRQERLSTFEQQRKKVEIQFFNKQTTKLQWSQDEVIN